MKEERGTTEIFYSRIYHGSWAIWCNTANGAAEPGSAKRAPHIKWKKYIHIYTVLEIDFFTEEKLKILPVGAADCIKKKQVKRRKGFL